MEGNKKNRRKQEDQARAAEMKRLGIERTQGRCPICNRVYHADMLGRGYGEHHCEAVFGRK
jgi:hypothetical protein